MPKRCLKDAQKMPKRCPKPQTMHSVLSRWPEGDTWRIGNKLQGIRPEPSLWFYLTRSFGACKQTKWTSMKTWENISFLPLQSKLSQKIYEREQMRYPINLNRLCTTFSVKYYLIYTTTNFIVKAMKTTGFLVLKQ